MSTEIARPLPSPRRVQGFSRRERENAQAAPEERIEMTEKIRITADGKEMILIPAGTFIMGSEEYPNESPQRVVALPAYYIDKYPVTNEEYKRFVDSTGRRPPQGWNGTHYPEGKSDHPVEFMSWEDAKAYAGWAGKRLPTEAEWEKAARGTDGRRWPWGNEFDEAKAWTWEAHLLGDSRTTSVRAHPEGASPYGVCEMVGQVEEWVEDWLDAYEGSSYRSVGYGKRYKVLRGGSWIFTQDHARCAYRCFEKPVGEYPEGFKGEDDQTQGPFSFDAGGPGFRCAMDAGEGEGA